MTKALGKEIVRLLQAVALETRNIICRKVVIYIPMTIVFLNCILEY